MTELPGWARGLDLSPHPEGGWFRETWRSDLLIPPSSLPVGYTGPRNAGTAILFLLLPGQQSAWHTVRSAEMWLFHRGSPLLLEIGRDGRGGQGPARDGRGGQERVRDGRGGQEPVRERERATTLLLGADVDAGERPQVLVPPGHWQRATPRDDEATLVSCVVVPGFDFADFALHAPTD